MQGESCYSVGIERGVALLHQTYRGGYEGRVKDEHCSALECILLECNVKKHKQNVQAVPQGENRVSSGLWEIKFRIEHGD